MGQAHQRYSFEDRFKALLSRSRKTIEQEIKTGFGNVPKGCSIQLEKQSQDYILENIRNAINTKRNIISKLYVLIETRQELKVREFFEGLSCNPARYLQQKGNGCGIGSSSRFT